GLGLPSLLGESIGLPIDPLKYFTLPYYTTCLDSYLWAATCANIVGTVSLPNNGMEDNQLRFDYANMRLSYYLSDQYIPPNTVDVHTGPLYMNPRWFNDKAPVVPSGII